MSACATYTFGVIDSVGRDQNKHIHHEIHKINHTFLSQVNRGYGKLQPLPMV